MGSGVWDGKAGWMRPLKGWGDEGEEEGVAKVERT